MTGTYPVEELSNGIKAKFMCLNKEGLEMYKNLNTGQTNLIKDQFGTWSINDGTDYVVRKTPLFGVVTIKNYKI